MLFVSRVFELPTDYRCRPSGEKDHSLDTNCICSLDELNSISVDATPRATSDYKLSIGSLATASTEVRVEIRRTDTREAVKVDALLDCGATNMFMDREFAAFNNFPVERLPRAIPVYNADGTRNCAGSITETCTVLMRYLNHTEKVRFFVTSTSKSPIIVGHNWLVKHNPEINWKTGEVTLTRCPSSCGRARVDRLKAEAKARKITKHARTPASDTDPDTESDDETLPDRPSAVERENIFRFLKGESQVIRVIIPDIGVTEIPQLFRKSKTPVAAVLRKNAKQTVPERVAEKEKRVRMEGIFEEVVPEEYRDFRDVFEKEGFDELPPRRPWDHPIDLKPDAVPVKLAKTYPLSPVEQRKLDEFLEENLKSGRIRESKSPWASGFFFVKKKDGQLRPVQDYRKLNDATVKNAYPLPLISEIVARLRKAKVFTKMDVRWGFNNIRIREGDEHKAAFLTNRGLFEPTVMFFGLCNSPATFQTMMNNILGNLVRRGVVLVYMDDILIFTETLAEHRKVVREVLQILRTHRLFLKPEKCSFEKDKVDYLGMIIGNGAVEMDPEKVRAVKEWPTPRTVKDTQRFVGFCNFYRKFISNFAHIAQPLYSLARNASVFRWTTATATAFQQLKDKITSSPVLALANDNDPFKLEADASDFASGAVLSQLQENVWKPVAFYSKQFSAAERNYEVHDKEMLAIIRGLEEWRHYVQGSPKKLEIWSDHRNLEYFLTAHKLNRRQARWSCLLADYDYVLKHRPGSSMLKADALSRRPDHKKGVEGDNDEVTLLTKEHVAKLYMRSMSVAESEGDAIIEEIKAKGLARVIPGIEEFGVKLTG
ncbi:hypothetical protein NP233_g13028 [Leucocoprinus birnbaumii]|uniref:RNA-directed DNA polymerase n=1 Tax=Leucocoprinus birnbaumii TaxID=56174 RepID=A0AAD5VDH6_9AGAR|nr:hypothetical protein NP233_g13028 [Leucocoprinus birnbaumii]